VKGLNGPVEGCLGVCLRFGGRVVNARLACVAERFLNGSIESQNFYFEKSVSSTEAPTGVKSGWVGQRMRSSGLNLNRTIDQVKKLQCFRRVTKEYKAFHLRGFFLPPFVFFRPDAV
jgi:hypothetical protein